MKREILRFRAKTRESLIERLLIALNFRNIRDHWVYIKALTESSVVIDLGANTGTFSRLIRALVGADCFVIEPNRNLFNSLESNRYHKYNLAVTNRDGPVHFYISENPEASSVISGFQDLWDVEKLETVEGVTWNTLLNRLNISEKSIDLVKVDIEGAELDLIESLTLEDCEHIHQLTFEFHHRLNPSLHLRTKAAIKKLISFNYLDISTGISPTEVLFIRENQLKLNLPQKLLLFLYKKLKFKTV